MSTACTLDEIAGWIDGQVRSGGDTRITGVSGIADALPDQITWFSDRKFSDALSRSRAGAVIIPRDFETAIPAIEVDNPALAIITVLQRFAPPIPRPPTGIHPTAVVADTARLGRNVAIGPGAILGERVQIGDNTIIHARVTLSDEVTIGADCEIWSGVVIRERCRIGSRVIIHPNSTIGADGFGYQFSEGRHRKIPQIGIVAIEDDVEIGANCTIDRAKFGATRIGAGTKIDNLVQVAHNVQIGQNCILVAQCAIAGSTTLGNGVMLGGKVGIREHVTLHDGARAGACCCISKDVPAGMQVFGIPAIDQRQWVKERGTIKRLPAMADEIQALKERVKKLEAAADD